MGFSWKGELGAQGDTRNKPARKNGKAHDYSVLSVFALRTPSQTIPQTPCWSKVIPLQPQMCCLEPYLESNPSKASPSYSRKSKHSFGCISPFAEIYYISKELNEQFGCFK